MLLYSPTSKEEPVTPHKKKLKNWWDSMKYFSLEKCSTDEKV
jgi:hypothetical protein